MSSKGNKRVSIRSNNELHSDRSGSKADIENELPIATKNYEDKTKDSVIEEISGSKKNESLSEETEVKGTEKEKNVSEKKENSVANKTKESLKESKVDESALRSEKKHRITEEMRKLIEEENSTKIESSSERKRSDKSPFKVNSSFTENNEKSTDSTKLSDRKSSTLKAYITIDEIPVKEHEGKQEKKNYRS